MHGERDSLFQRQKRQNRPASGSLSRRARSASGPFLLSVWDPTPRRFHLLQCHCQNHKFIGMRPERPPRSDATNEKKDRRKPREEATPPKRTQLIATTTPPHAKFDSTIIERHRANRTDMDGDGTDCLISQTDRSWFWAQTSDRDGRSRPS